MNVKESWCRYLRENQNLSDVSYESFRRTACKLSNVKSVRYVSEDLYNKLAEYYNLKRKGLSFQFRNGTEKIALLRTIAKRQSLTGKELIVLCEVTRAFSTSSLYYYSQKRLGEKFSTKNLYTPTQVKKILLNLDR